MIHKIKFNIVLINLNCHCYFSYCMSVPGQYQCHSLDKRANSKMHGRNILNIPNGTRSGPNHHKPPKMP